MGYVVKHSTSNVSKTRRKGNVTLGVSSEGYSKTSVSGLYNGVPPVEGKHNFVRTSATGDPNFYCVDDTELINFVNSIGGSVSNVADATAYLATQNDIMFTNTIPSDAVTDGLVLELNASNLSSYPGLGNTWYDLSGKGFNSTLTNSPLFNSNGTFQWDGTNDYSLGYFDSNLLNGDYTIEAEFKHQGTSQWEAVWSNNAVTSSWSNSINLAPILTFNGGSYPTTQYQIGHNAVGISPTGVFLDLTSAHMNKWVKVWLTRSGTAISIYAKWSGTNLSTSGTFSAYSITPRFGYVIGRHWYNSGNGGQTFNGEISKIKVYNKVLTNSEILQNYYGGPIVTDGLVLAVYAGNLVSYESGSTTTYSLTGSLSGSLDNGTGYLPDNGGTWDFDGTNDQINFGNQSSLGFTSGVFSVEAWIYIPSSWTAGSQYPNLVSKGAKAGWDTDGWSLFCFRNYGSGTGYAVGIGLRNSGTTNIRVAYNQPTDVWLHVMGTLDGSSIKIYVNGGLQVNQSQTINPASNSSNVLIGRDTQGNSFPGKIANVKTYNKTLSDSEVLQNYNAQKSRFI